MKETVHVGYWTCFVCQYESNKESEFEVCLHTWDAVKYNRQTGKMGWERTTTWTAERLLCTACALRYGIGTVVQEAEMAAGEEVA